VRLKVKNLKIRQTDQQIK